MNTQVRSKIPRPPEPSKPLPKEWRDYLDNYFKEVDKWALTVAVAISELQKK